MLLLLPPLLPLMLLAPPHYDDRAAILEKDMQEMKEAIRRRSLPSSTRERLLVRQSSRQDSTQLFSTSPKPPLPLT